MTEREYIDATNLTNLRLSLHALGETVFTDREGNDWRAEMVERIRAMIEVLEKKVKLQH